MLADIVNGLTRNDITMKFKLKQYENQKKAIGERQAYEYIKMAYRIMAEDRVKEQNQLRDQLYNQYLALYNDMVVNGNSFAAKSCLDSIAKIFLPPAEQNINLNGNIDGNVTIDFNFVEDEG